MTTRAGSSRGDKVESLRGPVDLDLRELQGKHKSNAKKIAQLGIHAVKSRPPASSPNQWNLVEQDSGDELVFVKNGKRFKIDITPI